MFISIGNDVYNECKLTCILYKCCGLSALDVISLYIVKSGQSHGKKYTILNSKFPLTKILAKVLLHVTHNSYTFSDRILINGQQLEI